MILEEQIRALSALNITPARKDTTAWHIPLQYSLAALVSLDHSASININYLSPENLFPAHSTLLFSCTSNFLAHILLFNQQLMKWFV